MSHTLFAFIAPRTLEFARRAPRSDGGVNQSSTVFRCKYCLTIYRIKVHMYIAPVHKHNTHIHDLGNSGKLCCTTKIGYPGKVTCARSPYVIYTYIYLYVPYLCICLLYLDRRSFLAPVASDARAKHEIHVAESHNDVNAYLVYVTSQ